MSAITPTSGTLKQESLGSLKLHIASFAAGATTGDSWASGIPNIAGAWANQTGSPNTDTNYEGVQISVSGTTITFNACVAETMTGFDCYVVSRAF